MNDLRSLLEQAAGDSPTPVSVAAVRRRASSITRRRRVGTMAAIAAVGALLVVTVARFPVHRALPTRPPQIEQGRLAPGTYTATVLGQDLSVTVPGGLTWTAIRVEPSELALFEQPDLVQVKLLRWNAVHRYTAEGAAVPATDLVPGDLMSWLSRHPGVLATGSPTATTLAGRPAHRIRLAMDYRYNGGAGSAAGCSNSPSACIVLADTTDGFITLTPNSDLTVTAQDRTDDRRLIVVELNFANATVPTPMIR